MTTMANTDFDIVILGTGPVGCALALKLAQKNKHPERICLIGLEPGKPVPGQIFDPRALAMNYGSRQFLTSLGVWPQQAADMLTVHVSQSGYLGRTTITHTDLQVDCLGSVVTYDDLLANMYGQLKQSGICLIPEIVTKPKPSKTICINTKKGVISTRMAVISHGAKPKGIHRTYNQHAVLGTISASQAKTSYAFERFTADGPLALLPHPQGNDLYSLVWCLPPAQAKIKSLAANTVFEQDLQHAFGTRLGTLKLVGKRFTFPLDLYAGNHIQGQHLIALGNAAQTMHPVAGQGLNLGLRDVAQLGHMLKPWLAQPDNNIQELLIKFAARRRLDRGLTMAITDTLPRAFLGQNPLRKHACGLGLLAMDLISPARHSFARHLLQGQRL